MTHNIEHTQLDENQHRDQTNSNYLLYDKSHPGHKPTYTD